MEVTERLSLLEFLADEQLASQGTGRFTSVLMSLITGCGFVHRQVNGISLGRTCVATDRTNVQGERVHALDDLANTTLIRNLRSCSEVAGMASEEEEDVVQGNAGGRYLLTFDPMDGVSNIEVSVGVGTIFSILLRRLQCCPVSAEEFFQPGRNILAAGYVLYGSNTKLVITFGNGVHEFTFDPGSGNFLLTRKKITLPDRCRWFSVNEGYESLWDHRVRSIVSDLKQPVDGRVVRSGRHIGSLVADFHRNLIDGGVFLYPANSKHQNGKLRLLYEANPLAFVVEQAGGSASTGRGNVLDAVPSALHQRTPLYIGNTLEVERIERVLSVLD